MRGNKLILIISILMVVAGCSTIQTYIGFQDTRTITANKSYQLRVQTRNEVLDQLVYEMAYKEFTKYVPITEKGPYAGTIDVLFFKTSETNFVDPGSLFSNVTGYADRWYTKDGYVGTGNSTYTIGAGITYGGAFTWQNSTMLVNIKDKDQKKLWTAEYKYKIHGESLGWFANTTQEIVLACVTRIGWRMKKDFTPPKPHVKPTRNYRERDKLL